MYRMREFAKVSRSPHYSPHAPPWDRGRLWLLVMATLLAVLGLAAAVNYVDVTAAPPPDIEFTKTTNVARVPLEGFVPYNVVVAYHSGTGPLFGMVTDTLPDHVSLVAGSIVTSTGQVNHDAGHVYWTLDQGLESGSTATLTFMVQVHFDPELCALELVNQATLQHELGDDPLEAIAPPVLVVCPDLGDAPDSDSNHHVMDNTAYPVPVLGHFPTVWGGTPPTEPAGPLHLDASKVWLGDFVSYEMEADLLPDGDAQTNILANGQVDIADQDKEDDGWLNPHVPIVDCHETSLKVRVSRALGAQTGPMYLNVWFDGNRDGDWADTRSCQDGRIAHEWIVQNYVINTAVIQQGFKDFWVPTVLVLNDEPLSAAWLRFTLSEVPAPAAGQGVLPDGRGLHPPEGFALGETEDYLQGASEPGTPGTIVITKTVSAPTVQLGEIFTYSVVLHHVGGTGLAHTALTDTLPAAVQLAGPPQVTELNPSVMPHFARFYSGRGPSGTVIWHGYLSPGAKIRLDIPVKLQFCPQGGGVITNVAAALQTDKTLISAQVDVTPDCDEPLDPGIGLQKRLLLGDELLSTANILPGHEVRYRLMLTSTSALTHTVHITDNLPAGLIGLNVHASSGAAHLIHAGRIVIWDGQLGPANQPLYIWIRARFSREVECEQLLINQAQWVTRFFAGESNEVAVHLRCWDLGDAPDSTNHFGVPMTAYPNAGPISGAVTGTITGAYPTVFGVSSPEFGPAHRYPHPFHLGRRVSIEEEADIGLDADPLNNILPLLDIPDRDRFDDGVDWSKVSFDHCRPAQIPVEIYIAPHLSAIFTQTERMAYLNLWLDSNRDGDWADDYDCSGVSGVHEHIVIDHPVDVGALGPGLHIIHVTTNKPIFWPEQWENHPAWLRVTLSERVSNKTLGGGSYGDGRGYALPFLTGETEDYLYYAPANPERPADPAVDKRGYLYPNFEPQAGQQAWFINWMVEYQNKGLAPALNVRVVDSYTGPQLLIDEHSYPHLVPTIDGQTLTYTVGALAAGAQGFIGLHAELPFTITPGTVLTNTVTILSDNDAHPGNNAVVVTRTIPLLPPLIVFPRPGTICTGTFTVTGRAQIGTLVNLYVDGALVATLSPDASGHWNHPVTLTDGLHDFYASARTPGGLTSLPSPHVKVIVDSTLSWNPLSLRFRDENGHLFFPRDMQGRADETGWHIFLNADTTYTVTVGLCCTEPNAQVTLEVAGVGLITLTDPDGDQLFEGVFTTPIQVPTHWYVRLCVTCNLVQRCTDGEVLIDPEGTVFDVIHGTEIEAATVGCYEEQAIGVAGSEGTYTLWNATDYGQVNPQTTAAEGYFSFYTPPGTYQLDVSKTDYQPYRSWEIAVTDAPVHYDIPLAPELNVTPDYTITISAGGFDPPILTVAPGTVIAWLNIDADPHTTTSITPTVSYGGAAPTALPSSAGWDSGLLAMSASHHRQLDVPGTYTYYDYENPNYTGILIVEYQIYLPLVLRNSD